MRMNRTVAPVVIVLGVIALGVALLSGGGDGYVVHVPMKDAGGLRQGAEVARGGVTIGKVALEINDDRVDAKLKIKDKYAPIPSDATVAIVASNLLGQKHIEIVGGSRAKPSAPGSSMSAKQVTQGTDLDQVLDVLDADTRTRLAILLNEAGNATAGRKTDIGRILNGLPVAFTQATETVHQLVRDNHTLGEVVERTDRFIAEAAKRRTAARRLVNRLGAATDSLASRRAGLRQTLAAAPATLTQLRGFLSDLERTTVPLGPAAREISASAPLVRNLLDEVEPLRIAADPTLKSASRVAPQLTMLGVQATPVVRKALPTAKSLTQLAQALPPLGNTLNKTSDNLLATADNWTRAIQFRDGMSHVFRGEASVSPDLLLSAINRVVPPAKRKTGSSKKKPSQTTSSPVPNDVPKVPVPKLPGPLQKIIDDVTNQTKLLEDTVDAVSGLLAGKAPPKNGKSGSTAGAQGLLDYLLGN